MSFSILSEKPFFDNLGIRGVLSGLIIGTFIDSEKTEASTAGSKKKALFRKRSTALDKHLSDHPVSPDCT